MSAFQAADIGFDQAGAIIDDRIEPALYSLDQRSSPAHLIDDLHVAMTLTDDFLGNTRRPGRIGELGWAATATAGGTATVEESADGPGIIRLSTGGTATGRMALDLGNHDRDGGAYSLGGCPVFVQETRCRLDARDTADQTASVYVGLVGYRSSTPPGGEPVGCYFRYSEGKWWAVCARGPRALTSTEIPFDPSAAEQWHRFRVTSDGGGVVRFYVDDERVAVITTTVPIDQLYVPSVDHGPTIEIRKTRGRAPRALLVDYYTLRWEAAR
jgi:hypothetical protein